MYIEVNSLTKKIKDTVVLNNINATFTGGKIYGLKGKNGSGKTMLMRVISGLIFPTEGYVNINGKVLGKDISFPESIGVLIENPSFIPFYSGYKNLKIIADIKKIIGEEKIKDVLANVGLDPEDRKKYKKYSLGMKQRLGIACAIMEDPDIILLDEPFNAIDEKGVSQIKDIILEKRNEGKIIILSCHDKEELEGISDEIFTMENGEITGHKVMEGYDEK